jgi:gliding motility-associated-like protein
VYKRQCQFQVNVIDNQAPSITCATGGPFTVPSNTGTCTYTQTSNAWNAGASDLCAGAVTLTYSLSGASTGTGTSLNGQVFNSGTTHIVWTATDATGNTSTCTFNVTVTDAQNPIILTCGPSTTPIVNVNSGLCTYTKSGTGWNPTVSDNCSTYSMNYTLSGATTGTGTSLSGVQFNLGITTVSWLATDGSGNTSSCSFQVNVVDIQVPIFTDCGPVGNQQVNIDAGECNYTVLGSGWDANASDNCSVSTMVYSMTGSTTGTGTSLQNVNFNLGLTTVVWTATDGSGNFANCSFQVLVRDMQYPSITNCATLNAQVLPANTGVCTYTNVSAAWNAVATDNCTVSQLTYTLSGATSGTGTSLAGVIFNPGNTNVLWTATDIAGNAVSCSFTVQITDNQAPIITNCPNDILVNSATGQCDTQVNWTAPSFTDNCGATMTVNIPSGTLFPVGTTGIVYTVTDGSGNYSTCSFNVTVTDNQVPIINCPPSVTSCDPIISYAFPTAIDNCGIESIFQVSGTLGGTIYPIGTTTDVYMATDIHGNTATCAVDITVHELPGMTVGVSHVSCFGLSDAVIDLIPFNGTPPYAFQWDNGWTQEDLFGIPVGTYSVEITDVHGCSRDTSITVSQPFPLALESSEVQVLCAAGSNGSIALNVTGGTDPYTYNWSNGMTESQVNELVAGTYSSVISDANGCVIDFQTTLTAPDTLTLTASIEDAACNATNGAILVDVTGGTAPYTYQWSEGSATVNLINVPHGVYGLEVTDMNGCSIYFEDTIQSLNNLNAYSVINNASCFGDHNGQIDVFVRTGSGPFTFTWSDGSSGAINDSLSAGDYSVLITDLYGCQAIVTASITEPDSLTLHLGSPLFTGGYNISSSGGSDGSITATVNGGTSPYTYLWSNGETSPSIHDLNSGIYSVIVTDEHGCPIYGTIRLSEPGILEMPNGFSPNGDSDNEYFVIHGLDAYPENHFVVYNRWGNIVYEKSNYENEWHGVNKTGEVLPDGTYFVILTVTKDGEEKALSGYVDMRRSH